MNESAGGLTQIRPSARPGGFLGEGLRAITWNRMADPRRLGTCSHHRRAAARPLGTGADRPWSPASFRSSIGTRSSAILPSPMPFLIGWCTTLTGSRSRATASEKRPPSVRSLTTSLPTDLMMTSTREPAQQVQRNLARHFGQGLRRYYRGWRLPRARPARCARADGTAQIRE